MQQKPSALVKPTLDTTFHIDYSWWDRTGEDLRTYLLSHLAAGTARAHQPEHRRARRRLH